MILCLSLWSPGTTGVELLCPAGSSLMEHDSEWRCALRVPLVLVSCFPFFSHSVTHLLATEKARWSVRAWGYKDIKAGILLFRILSLGLPFHSPCCSSWGWKAGAICWEPRQAATQRSLPLTMKLVLANYHGTSPPTFFLLCLPSSCNHISAQSAFWPLGTRLKERWKVSWLISTSLTTHRQGETHRQNIASMSQIRSLFQRASFIYESRRDWRGWIWYPQHSGSH